MSESVKAGHHAYQIFVRQKKRTKQNDSLTTQIQYTGIPKYDKVFTQKSTGIMPIVA